MKRCVQRVLLVIMVGLTIKPLALAQNTDVRTFTLNELGYSVRRWVSDHGAPFNQVRGIAETPDGYLWVLTPNDLVRFDGLEFESMHVNREPGYVEEPFFGPMYVHSDGRFLFRRRGRMLVSYKPGDLADLNEAKGLTTPQFTGEYLPAPDGRMLVVDWYAHRTYRFQDGRLYPEVEFPDFRNYLSLVFDRDAQLRGIDQRAGGLYIFADEPWKPDGELGERNTSKLFLLKDGRPAVIGHQGVYARSSQGWESVRRFERPIPGSEMLHDVVVDERGNFWMLTGRLAESLIVVRSSGTWGRVQLPGSAHDVGFGFFVDSRGVIWLAGDGLYQLNPQHIRTIPVRERPGPSVPLYRVVVDQATNVWASSRGAVWQIDASQQAMKPVRVDVPFSPGHVFPDDDGGGVQVASVKHIWRLGPDGWRQVAEFNHTPLDLALGPSNRWWVGNTAGLFSPDGQHHVGRTRPESRRTLFAGRQQDGTLIAAVLNEGLYQSIGETWDRLTDDDDDGSHEIMMATVDSDDVVWTVVGRPAQRLARWKAGQWFVYPPDLLQLPFGTQCVIADRRNGLWFGASGEGLFRFDRGELNRLALDERVDVTVRQYAGHDGLASLQFARASAPAE
ncbi:MAG: two-component regulator propeller domain-containing protein, partial [Verrucomicrobiota bacterium]